MYPYLVVAGGANRPPRLFNLALVRFTVPKIVQNHAVICNSLSSSLKDRPKDAQSFLQPVHPDKNSYNHQHIAGHPLNLWQPFVDVSNTEQVSP